MERAAGRLERQSRHHLFNVGFAGQLLVGAARAWLAGFGDWEAIESRFLKACGRQRGPEVLACVVDFLDALTRATRRPVRVNLPRSFGLSHDEWLIVQMIAAGQDDDRPALAAMLCLLFRRHEAERLQALLESLSEHLLAVGLMVPRQAPERPEASGGGAPELLVACG